MVRCDIVISISMIVIINVCGLIGISVMSISRVILGVLLLLRFVIVLVIISTSVKHSDHMKNIKAIVFEK